MNTKQEKINVNKVKNVMSTMAIENMYFDKKFIQNMIKVANGEMTSEDMRRSVLKKYGR